MFHSHSCLFAIAIVAVVVVGGAVDVVVVVASFSMINTHKLCVLIYISYSLYNSEIISREYESTLQHEKHIQCCKRPKHPNESIKKYEPKCQFLIRTSTSIASCYSS